MITMKKSQTAIYSNTYDADACGIYRVIIKQADIELTIYRIKRSVTLTT